MRLSFGRADQTYGTGLMRQAQGEYLMMMMVVVVVMMMLMLMMMMMVVMVVVVVVMMMMMMMMMMTTTTMMMIMMIITTSTVPYNRLQRFNSSNIENVEWTSWDNSRYASIFIIASRSIPSHMQLDVCDNFNLNPFSVIIVTFISLQRTPVRLRSRGGTGVVSFALRRSRI
jgi:hypothetical protein